MSTATPEQLRQLAEQAQNFAPEAALRPRRPSQFLSLAPSTSDSFPRKPSNAEPLTTEALASISAAPKQRRASSLSSDASKNQFRFLKLGPVHWGEHIDEDNKGDFHEVAVEE
ncbi:hypothetical protein QBC42DRAFT_299972 [Cladorrhinum samala]|uniref:Uncharacterized protein n=1 Tax=Cladorrhinum samala TaxID=585594 RepID=A0AAV9HGM8_9PEZI|nr:hypothetical protein QBC42DRAFT_299972 [Cladorrhinum samala]